MKRKSNKQLFTTHGNAPKGPGSYLRHKIHIQHTHPQHLSTQTSTNQKHSLQQDGLTEGDTHGYLQGSYETSSEYASSIWSPLTSSTSINKLLVMQNAELRTATGCTHDTNIQHLHDETLTLPIHEHLQLHASQYKTENTISITSLTQTHNILQYSKAKKKHYF